MVEIQYLELTFTADFSLAYFYALRRAVLSKYA